MGLPKLDSRRGFRARVRQVEAYKEAFALRLSLGDPGPPGSDSNANISDIMRDILDPQFADLLRSVCSVGHAALGSGRCGQWAARRSVLRPGRLRSWGP